MRPILLLSFLSAIALGGSLRAQRLYVDAGAPLYGNGALWSTAFGSLQEALKEAGPGSEIWVASGTYLGGFTVPAGVRLLGGFRNGDTRESQREPRVQRTILDGGNTQRVLDLGDQCLVDGFEVRNGRAPFPGGGGALADGTSPILRGCLFVGNGNSAGRGSAILVRNGGQPQVSYCEVRDSVGPGHVIDVDAAGGTYDHVTVFRNVENGLHMQDGAAPVITNSIFVQNTGRGICDFAFGAVNQPILEHNLFWDNGVSMYHYRGAEYQSAVDINALSYAGGNLGADPLFADEMADDLRLSEDSPAVDEGAGAVAPGFDFAGNLRLSDGDLDGVLRPDIGALEYTGLELRLTGDIVSGGTLDVIFTGKAGVTAALVLGVYDGVGTLLVPCGQVHLDLGQPIAIGLVVTLPAAPIAIPIPGDIAPGATFGLQAVTLSAPTGNLSRPYDLLIR